MNLRSVRDLSVGDRKVLLRVDFNVPLANGEVGDDTRIRAALPTIQYLREERAMTIACSHLGRPKGQIVPSLSLRPVTPRLNDLLGAEVAFAPDCVGPPAESAAAALAPGEVLLLENTRFHAEERVNEPSFAAELASLADLYVNDAFGTAHRAHASTEGVAHHLPSAAGLLIEREVRFLDEALKDPERPYVAVLGGAKISDKIAVIRSLLQRVDLLLVGGAMANTFLAAAGVDLADSLTEPGSFEIARELRQQAGSKLRLPVDVVAAASEAEHRAVAIQEVPAGWKVLDIGPATQAEFAEAVAEAGTVVWNGPMGMFEVEPFDAGTRALAEAIGRSAALSVVGGGDSVAAVRAAGLAEQITHLSTGGGAALTLLEGRPLPGLEVLRA